MKTLLAFLLFAFLHVSLSAAKPNVILVFIDDMGWGDFSCFGNEAAKTPNIDRMAKSFDRQLASPNRMQGRSYEKRTKYFSPAGNGRK